MTPELLAMLTPEEREAWALCEGASPAPRWDRSWDEQPYFRDGYKRSKFAIGPQYGVPAHPNTPEDKERGAEVAAKVYADAAWMQNARTSLPAALTTIAALRAELNGILDDARVLAAVVGVPADSDAPMTEALRRVEELVAARDTLRETLAEQQRAFVIGLDLAQRTADTEIAELRARLTTGIGLPLGVNDRDGNPVHVGDTLAFDGWEWSRTHGAPDHIYTVEYARGVILTDGTVSDIPSFCRVVKRWNEKAADDAVKGAT